MKAGWKYNRRLEDPLMTAAMNVVHFDPNSHLAGYHRSKGISNRLLASPPLGGGPVDVLSDEHYSVVMEYIRFRWDERKDAANRGKARRLFRGGQDRVL